MAFMQTIPQFPFHPPLFYHGFDAIAATALHLPPCTRYCHLCLCALLPTYSLCAALLFVVLLLSAALWLVSLFCRDFLAVPCRCPAFSRAAFLVSRLPLVAIYAHFALVFLVCRDFLTYYDKLFSLLIA